MLPRDLVATSWQNLWVHRLRAILSILGIIIGIGSFSIMQSVGEGARQETIRIMKELGSDVLTLTQNVNPSDPGSKPNRPTIEDLRNGLKGSLAISAVSGKFSEQVELPLRFVDPTPPLSRGQESARHQAVIEYNLAIGQATAARREAEEWVAANPGAPLPRALLGEALAAQGLLPEALAAFEDTFPKASKALYWSQGQGIAWD